MESSIMIKFENESFLKDSNFVSQIRREKKLVVHCQKEPFDVYIGRSNYKVKHKSEWGNPFKIDSRNSREDVIKAYEKWLISNPKMVEKAKRELKGKILGCFCSPLACHGDVLSRIANEE